MKKLFQLLKNNAQATKPGPIVAAVENDQVTIYMYDVISADWGISALDVARVISTLDPDTTLNIRLNSPGGDVFEARAISTAIKNHPGKVVVYIDGLAASAATTIASAADAVEIAEGSFYMIHNAWTFAMGDKSVLRETADLLEKVDGAISNDYASRTGIGQEEIAAMMDAETWLDAQQAVDMKFADRLQPEGKKKNTSAKTWNLSAFDNAPEILTKKQEEIIIPENYAAMRANNERRLRLLSIV